MKLTARVVDVPPAPLELARRLRGRPGAVLLWSARGGGASYIASDPVDGSHGLDPEPALVPAAARGELVSAPRWIGVLPYEAMRHRERGGWTRCPDARAEPQVPRPIWLRYGAVARVTDRVLVIGDDAGRVDHLRRLLQGPAPGPAPVSVTLRDEPELLGAHAERIARALELIAAGDLYQVNLARRLAFDVTGHPIDLVSRLAATAPAPYAAALDLHGVGVVSTSPELFLALDPDRRVWTSPIKGTRPRGIDAATDRALAQELDADPKECAELAMILDVERNDLGRIAETGSVRVSRWPAVTAHRTLFHRGATVSARVRRGVHRQELLEAMLPSGSVTGAPKVRAMEVIATLEPHRRGLYTGALGFLSHDGGLRLSMAIRVLTVAGGEGHYLVGGGIVADSDPWQEVDETGWKSVQISLAGTERKSPEQRQMRLPQAEPKLGLEQG